MQKWIKKGLIYCPSGKKGFDKSHCHKPTPLIIDDETVRVYFGVRDENSKTRTTFIDLSINNLNEIKYVHDKPVIDLGKIGCFDDIPKQDESEGKRLFCCKKRFKNFHVLHRMESIYNCTHS